MRLVKGDDWNVKRQKSNPKPDSTVLKSIREIVNDDRLRLKEPEEEEQRLQEKKREISTRT